MLFPCFSPGLMGTMGTPVSHGCQGAIPIHGRGFPCAEDGGTIQRGETSMISPGNQTWRTLEIDPFIDAFPLEMMLFPIKIRNLKESSTFPVATRWCPPSDVCWFIIPITSSI